jgi:hypothetical protein
MDENDNTKKYIREYIQEHRHLYTPSIIKQKLLEAGYSQADIDDVYDSLVFDTDTTAMGINEVQSGSDSLANCVRVLVVIVIVFVVLALVLYGICVTQYY